MHKSKLKNTLRVRNNIYDYIIVLTIISVIFAGELFGAFTPIVLLGFLASIYSIFVKRIWEHYLIPRCKYLILFFLFFLIYSLGAISWISDRKQYVINVIWTYCFIFDFLLIFYCSLRANKPVKSIVIGWILFTVVNLCCSYWEITTGNHFASGSFNADNQNALKIYSAVTYGNYNSFSIVLCLSLVFNLLYMQLYNKLKNQIFALLLIICIFVVLLVNTSRGSLLCFILFSIPMWYTIRHIRGLRYIVLAIVLCLVGYIWYEYSEIISLIIEERLNSRPDAGEDPRWKLWKAGLEIANQWWYIGSGPGSMMYEYAKNHIFILYAHNLWIQLLVEYGLLITLIFIFICIKLVRKTLFSIDPILKSIGLYFVFCWPVLTIIDEGYMKVVHWIFFASIFSIIYHRKYCIYE